MAKFMMILHDSMPELSKLSPAEMQRVIGRYNAWCGALAQVGKFHGGEKLGEEGGKHLTAKAGKMVVRDGPFAEAKEVIGGYFLIEAKDYAEATKMCADCPHLELGGRIELRQVDVVPDVSH